MMVEESNSRCEAIPYSTRKCSRLLLVDDDPALRDALTDTIQFHLGPLTVDASDSATKALDLIRVNGYDAMIVDINMPNMNGLQFLAAVKHLQPHTPVLLISAHADEATIATAFETGASDFIPKPFDRDQIVSAVRHTLERRSTN
jgi:DNA-binding NtrC family response regulator